MKRNTPHHPKMYALAEALAIPLAYAVGIMEMLWQHASQHTPQGDIGSLPDAAIAGAVGWRKPTQLRDALVSSGWLEICSEHRLIIHDWPEHCEQSVVKWLEYNHKDFLPIYGVSLEDRKRKSRHSLPSRGAKAEAEAEAMAEVPEQETENPENSSTRASDFENLPFDTLDSKPVLVKPPVDRWFSEEFWPLYWRKVDRANALKAFKKYAVDEETKDDIVAAVKAQTPQFMARDSEHRPHASTWLNARRWEEDPEVFDPGKSAKRAGLTAEEIAAL